MAKVPAAPGASMPSLLGVFATEWYIRQGPVSGVPPQTELTC